MMRPWSSALFWVFFYDRPFPRVLALCGFLLFLMRSTLSIFPFPVSSLLELTAVLAGRTNSTGVWKWADDGTVYVHGRMAGGTGEQTGFWDSKPEENPVSLSLEAERMCSHCGDSEPPSINQRCSFPQTTWGERRQGWACVLPSPSPCKSCPLSDW